MSERKVIAKQPLDAVLGRMFTAWAGRRLAQRAEHHLAQGRPQVAAYVFDHVGRQVAMWGRYEREELELLMQALAPELGPRTPQQRYGVRALDIGANIGNHSLFFADHFEQVLAFEPHPRTFALLQFNAQLRANIECFDLALSERAGQGQLSTPAGNAGMASLNAQHLGALAHGAQKAACTLARLDDQPGLLEAGAPRVGLVKIDVEGHEAAVLRGGQAVFTQHRPIVVLEQAAEQVQEGSSQAVELLRSWGYSRMWTIEQYPSGRSRWLKLLRRAVFGEGLRVVQSQALEARFHSMVVMLPGPVAGATPAV